MSPILVSIVRNWDVVISKQSVSSAGWILGLLIHCQSQAPRFHMPGVFFR